MAMVSMLSQPAQLALAVRTGVKQVGDSGRKHQQY